MKETFGAGSRTHAEVHGSGSGLKGIRPFNFNKEEVHLSGLRFQVLANKAQGLEVQFIEKRAWTQSSNFCRKKNSGKV